jgi:type II secretion system protein J
MSDHGQQNSVSGAPRGFTLIEVLVATVIFSVLVGALYSVFYGTLRLRENAYEVTEARLPINYIAGLIKRDLKNTVAPVGLLAGPMLGENVEESAHRIDRLEFHTASGIVNDKDPWGDIQKVEYYLEEPQQSGESEGNDFVRALTRNLLASTTEEPQQERLLSGVQSLEFTYYDGEYWEEVWDSTTQENEMPLAVKVRIEFMPPEEGEREMRPIELVCEILANAGGTEEQEGEEGSVDGEGPGGSGGSSA